MKAKIVGYWICTALVAFSFLSGGIVDVIKAPQALEGMTRLGYPPYFMVILGVWKVLGTIVILLPGLALVKEWAYAGTGATASHLSMGDGLRAVVVPLVLAALVSGSWALRPPSRRLTPAPV
jgi:ABC-type multidrug transport system permease subunit